MLIEVIKYSLVFGIAVLISILFKFRKSIRNWDVLLMFFVIGFFDNLLFGITENYPGIQLIKSDIWNNYLICNWSAKLYSIIFVLVLLFLYKNTITPGDIGLKLKQNKNSVGYSLRFIFFFLVVAVIVGLSGKKGDFDTKVLLYLLVMPGLNEELIYRGFLLGLMNKIFDRKFAFLKTNFGWGLIITSVIFGLLHGLQVTQEYHFQIMNIPNVILTGIFGFIFGLMRERSGSLLFPVLAHSTVDFFHYLVRML